MNKEVKFEKEKLRLLDETHLGKVVELIGQNTLR